MAEITPIQFYRGTAAEWTSANPTLAAGKPGFETDTGKLKIGDGSTMWNSLGYQATEAAALLKAGGTMSGPIAMGTNKITGLGAATANGDAVRYEQVVPAQRSGTAITFDAPATYGYSAAETGNITLNATGLVEGTTQILIHNHSVEPTFDSNFKVVSGEYALSTVNYIVMVAVKSNLILVSINQEL